jgi:hypothetical protein
MKALGASMAATSAALHTYSNSQVVAKNETDKFIKTSPAMISAGGQAAAAFVKQTKTKAFIQGGFESAAALAAFGAGNFVAMAGHGAAAAAFFALAQRGGGKSAPKTRRASSALSAGGAGGAMITKSTAPIVVNVKGFALGSSADIGTQLGATINDTKETGIFSNKV